MTNKEKMIKGMKLLKEAVKLIKEGCKNIYTCNPIECPLYNFCYERFENPPCEWTIVEEDE